MQDEPAQKKRKFADPNLNVGIGKSGDDNLVPNADELPLKTPTLAADHTSQSAIAGGDNVVAPYVPSDAISGDNVVAPYVPSDGMAGDKVVAPYLPSSFAPLTARQKPGHSTNANFIAAMAKSFLQNSRSNFLLLALAITVVTVAWLFIQRLVDQASLDHHSELAQVNEYAKRTHTAALEWTEAIAAAKRLQLPAKVIADLDMRAQKAWYGAREETFMNEARKQISGARADEIFHEIDVHRPAELREAVALYARVENCRASEIRALWALEKMLDLPGQWYQPEMDKHDPLNSVRTNAPSENELLDQYCQKNPELSELVKASMNPHHAIGKLTQMQLSERQAQTLIPVMHEHVFTSSGLEPFLQAQQQLDRVLQEAGYNPLSFEDRLKLAKNAVVGNDDAAAVVEYLRCLGLKEDDQTGREFLQLCKGMSKKLQSYDQTARDHQEALTVLDKLHSLESKCFGADSDQALITLMARARILRSAGRFDEAEKTLDDLSGQKSVLVAMTLPTIQAEKGVMLAAAGKFEQAQTLLRKSVAANDQRAHMLETLANIESASGHFLQAQQTLDELKRLEKAGAVKYPDTFGILKPDQFDSTTVE